MSSPTEFKFKLQVAGQWVLLNHTQLDTILSVIDRVDCMVESWVGGSNGDNGSSYRTFVRPMDVQTLDFRTVRQDTIDAYKLVTKLYDEQNPK